MSRLTLDRADRAVKKFARSIKVGHDGIEVELEGQILFKIVPPAQLRRPEIDAFLRRGKELVRRARQRNASIPAASIDRLVSGAVREVRKRSR